jgi:hypothetical protein
MIEKNFLSPFLKQMMKKINLKKIRGYNKTDGGYALFWVIFWLKSLVLSNFL